ncbi:MAG: hypothetical protein WD116_00125 [Chloroflexota bacterium]
MNRRFGTHNGPASGIAAILLASAALALTTPAVLASHSGAKVDCGSAGTYTIRATENGAGFQAPDPSSVLIFEEGGTLMLFEVSVNGQVRFSNALTGRESNAVEETNCSFTIGSGAYFEVVGILNLR